MSNEKDPVVVEPGIEDRASLLTRAKRSDPHAIALMFQQFLPPDEQVLVAEFLGTRGVWGIGTHSFACVTNRRVAALRVKLFGEVEYQDGDLAQVNSAVIFQPSKLALYCFVAVFSTLTFGLGLLLLPFTVRLFYHFRKSGLVLWIREGISIYVFCDRKAIKRASAFYRRVLIAREGRLVEERAGSGASGAGGAVRRPVVSS